MDGSRVTAGRAVGFSSMSLMAISILCAARHYSGLISGPAGGRKNMSAGGEKKGGFLDRLRRWCGTRRASEVVHPSPAIRGKELPCVRRTKSGRYRLSNDVGRSHSSIHLNGRNKSHGRASVNRAAKPPARGVKLASILNSIGKKLMAERAICKIIRFGDSLLKWN